MEGRDIGTVVFPNAELKIFLEASPEVRAERRWKEHQEKGEDLTLAQVLEDVRERDKRDRERKASPLVRAADAVLVDKDRKSTRLNSSHQIISYAVFCLKYNNLPHLTEGPP